MAKVDTVGKNYYEPLEKTEKVGDVLFWLISIISIGALFIDKTAYPAFFGNLQVSLVVLVVLFFLQGQIQRLYLFPRAEDTRRKELLSNSFNVALTHEITDGYYNNDQKNPLKRLAASVMESAFFTGELCRKMLVTQRAKTIGYVVLYLIAVLNRSTNLELLGVAAQALFGGEIISRWLRMEWLRIRCEQAFANSNRLFGGRPAFSRNIAQSEALDQFSFYETTKSTASILISSRLYKKYNPHLTREWDRIRARLEL